MHIFCAAPIQSGACGQNGCLHASGHPGRYMRRRQRNGGSAHMVFNTGAALLDAVVLAVVSKIPNLVLICTDLKILELELPKRFMDW